MVSFRSSLQRLSQIGTRLAQRTRPNNNFFINSLKEAADALSKLQQSGEPQTPKEVQAIKKQEDALKPLIDAVVCRGLLCHQDNDVKLLVAICVTELFRVKAPEPPFQDQHLRDVFKLIIGLFAELANTANPFFSKRVKVLNTVAQLNCCVLMLEIDCKDLVLEMFNVFFSVVRDDHDDRLIKDMSSMMRNILDESEDASQELLEVILRNLIKLKKGATRASYELAKSVIKTLPKVDDELKPLVCKFISSCIHDKDAVDCKLKEYYHEIIFEIFQCAPHMLVPIFPSLIKELEDDQVDIRLKAVNLVGKLFAIPEQHAAQKFGDLFEVFLKRFNDVSVDVRISVLNCAKAFYEANPSGSGSLEKFITSVEGLLSDPIAQVRMHAVVVVCDICSSNSQCVPVKLMAEAIETLQDEKISVRKRALQKLMEIYRDYCKKCFEGSMIINDDFEEIPCKILKLCCDNEYKEFRSQSMELILADNLFPDDLSVEERTNHWIHMFSLFSSCHEKALNTILIQKRRLQDEMKTYLAIRKKLKEICAEEIQKEIKNVFTKIAASFSDSHKAEECLHKLNQIKDNNFFKSLEKLLEEPTFTKGRTIKNELLVMIGDKNPNYEFFRSLFSKCSSNIFSSEHVKCSLNYLSNDKCIFKDLEDSVGNLLLAIAIIFPSMLKDSEEKFQMLLEHTCPVNDTLIEIIAKEGPNISFNLSGIFPFLERMCLRGTRRQAKLAVSAIVSLGFEYSVVSKLVERLIYSLNIQWNVTTITQNLGYTAECSVSSFETQVEDITSCISQKISQMESLDDSDLTSSYSSSPCSKSCQLKEKNYCLNCQWNVPTILQSLGCIAQCSVSELRSQVEEIISDICERIIKMECLDDDDDDDGDDDHDLNFLHDTPKCGKSCQLKIYGLKTLVKSFFPDQGNQTKQNIIKLLGFRKKKEELLDILSRMLRKSDSFVNSEKDKAHIRLAAATAILHLAKMWDFDITPKQFRLTILIVKDSSYFVRSKFLSKTQKLLKQRKLPIRFACAFALATTERIDNLRFQNYKHMAEFIKDYSIPACRRRPSSVCYYPEYILVFLIHVLAWSNDFPEANLNAEVYADISRPLFFLLQALVDISIVRDRELVNDTVLYIFAIFRRIENLEAVDSHTTTIKLHKLAEIGMFTLKALYPGEISVSQAPEQLSLPPSLYKATSKFPESFFYESFLSRVFDILQNSAASQRYAQKPVNTLRRPARKDQQNVPRFKVNVKRNISSSKPAGSPMRDITNANNVKPGISSEKRRKHMPTSDSGSIRLHESSPIVKQQNLPSKQVENTPERNQFSSGDSASCKDSLVEPGVTSTIHTVTSSIHTDPYFKRPRTNTEDTCGSKDDLSAKHSTSSVEHVDSLHRDTHVSHSESSDLPRKSARYTNQSPNPRNFPNQDELPLFMHQYFKDVIDVAGDGHCGFRAVSGLLGRSVDEYDTIRFELRNELNKNRQGYTSMFGTEKRLNDIEYALTYAGIGYTNKWMMMPDMGFLIAQRYKYVVVLLSRFGYSETYFPLDGAPKDPEQLMCLGYVHNNHFMQIHLMNGCPLPPTSPLWEKHRRPDASNWPDRYVQRMIWYTELNRVHGGGGGVIVEDDLKPQDDKKVEDLEKDKMIQSLKMV
ncbi:sister chromatid cohesion protein PDS5 homolog B-like isoform X1 [Trifolium pratense]|nr:sister chromatid cohesion protein PDS5 homolog B-like isoform X1 [Trifolium pratense]